MAVLAVKEFQQGARGRKVQKVANLIQLGLSPHVTAADRPTDCRFHKTQDRIRRSAMEKLVEPPPFESNHPHVRPSICLSVAFNRATSRLTFVRTALLRGLSSMQSHRNFAVGFVGRLSRHCLHFFYSTNFTDSQTNKKKWLLEIFHKM